MLVGLICLGCCLYLAFSKTGSIRFGGPDAKPDLTTWQWFSICLCSGIGTGILFWGMAEPMFFYAVPSEAVGLEPFSRDAGVNAVSQAGFHWTIMQYSMYTMGAVGTALVAYNKGEDFSITVALRNLLGDKVDGPIGSLIHGICIFGLCGAVASSMGVALLQVGSGLNNIFGVTENPFLWLLIAIFITVVFTFSSIKGMRTGTSFLSSLNTKIFFGMAIYILIVGPRVFIADISLAAFGDLITTFFEKATTTNALTSDSWARDWTVQYYASFVVVAPLIGLFYARLAKGRTLREFIGMTILGPSVFCFLWISIFGGSAIFLQSSGQTDIWANIQASGMQSTVFNVFNQFPFAKIFTIVFVFTICTSLITYADPMTSILSVLSCKSVNIEQEPPTFLKLIWGVFIGSIAYILIVTGGIDGVRGMFTLIGFPLIFLLLGLCVAAVRIALKQIKNDC